MINCYHLLMACLSLSGHQFVGVQKIWYKMEFVTFMMSNPTSQCKMVTAIISKITSILWCHEPAREVLLQRHFWLRFCKIADNTKIFSITSPNHIHNNSIVATYLMCTSFLCFQLMYLHAGHIIPTAKYKVTGENVNIRTISGWSDAESSESKILEICGKNQ